MNKTIVITGAKQGIGKAMAEHFAKIGFNLIINDNEDRDVLDSFAKDLIKKYKIEVLSCFGDVSDEQYVNHMFNEILCKFKKIDILINNAAIVTDMEVKDRTAEIFNKTIVNNTASVFLMSKIFGQHMFKNKSGRIINISSTNGDKTIYPTSIDYDASKSAINSMTKNFAIEFAPYVLVNAIMPGWVMTKMNMQLDKDFLESEKQRIPLKHFQSEQDIVNAVEFLISENASSITGILLPVDGGLSLV